MTLAAHAIAGGWSCGADRFPELGNGGSTTRGPDEASDGLPARFAAYAEAGKLNVLPEPGMLAAQRSFQWLVDGRAGQRLAMLLGRRKRCLDEAGNLRPWRKRPLRILPERLGPGLGSVGR